MHYGVPPLKNYRFNNEDSSLGESLGGSIRYYYSDEDTSLAANQFKILYTFIGADNFDEGKYTLLFDKFGYWNENVDFVTIYDSSWTFDINLDTEANYSNEVSINQPIVIDDDYFNFKSIKITPFSCILSFEDSTNFINDKYITFKDMVPNITIILKDGTILCQKHFGWSLTADHKTNIYDVVLEFTVPITVEDAEAISIFGVEYAIK